MLCAPRRVARGCGIGHAPGDRQRVLGLVPHVTIGAMLARVERDLAIERGAGSLGSVVHSASARSQSVALAARTAGPRGRRTSSSSGATIPARAPASIDMLQTVMRSSIDIARIAEPGVLDGVADAAAGADRRDDREDHVLGGHAGAECARRR